MDIFKPEIYCKLEKKLEGPSDYCEIEEALDIINGDKKLQRFLKQYAINNGVRRISDEYRVGNKNVELVILSKTKDKGRTYDRINIGLDSGEDVMPIIYKHRHYEDGDYWGDTGYVNNSYRVKKTDKGYILEEMYNGSNHTGKRLIDIGIFDDVTKKGILDGLESAINKIIDGGK